MRKVIESTLVSLDGVIGDPITWINGYFGKQAQDIALAQLLSLLAMACRVGFIMEEHDEFKTVFDYRSNRNRRSNRQKNPRIAS